MSWEDIRSGEGHGQDTQEIFGEEWNSPGFKTSEDAGMEADSGQDLPGSDRLHGRSGKKGSRKKSSRKNKSGRHRGRRAAALFFLAVLAASLLSVSHVRKDIRKHERQFGELRKGEEDRRKGRSSPSDREAWENPDQVGWISIEGTSVSYPIMQTKQDNAYYLHRDYDRHYSICGTPFLDSRCGPESDNCIIYGHNINGGRMFGALHAFASEGYYREHPKICFRLREDERIYEIVSVMQTDIRSKVYAFTETGNWKEYRENIEYILAGSLYVTEVGKEVRENLENLDEEDLFQKYQFVTLSTCRSWIGRDARLLVTGVMERED